MTARRSSLALALAPLALALALLPAPLSGHSMTPPAGAAEMGVGPWRGSSGRVINGRDAALGEFPYQVSLQKKWMFGNGASHRCGGVVLNARHVLTAAHCVDGLFVSEVTLVAGVTDLSDNSPHRVSIDAQQVYIHEDFNATSYFNDIALIRLEEQFPLSSPFVSPVPLRASSLEPPAACVVTGWGNTREGSPWVYPDVLQALQLPLVEFLLCQELYDDYEGGDVVPGMLCAGFLQGDKDACDGDSGGPLVCGGLLTGLVSWGDDCARPNSPGVYTDVAFYREWLERTLARSYEDGVQGRQALR